jgi:hypothetical protein
MSRILTWTAGVLAFCFFMTANPASYVRQGSWIATADAIVGRPATPVSVAGVA